MGDRIVIRVTDGTSTSPDIYCHWLGLKALRRVHSAVMKSRKDVHNIMCNIVVEVMDGISSDSSFYLYNSGETDGMADWDNGAWILDIRTMEWSTNMTDMADRRYSLEEADRLSVIR